MATQTFEADRPVVLPRPTDTCEPEIASERELQGGVYRGLFFAMFFNAFLLFTGAAAWEVWRLMR